jgi:hypothetical protein
VESRDHLRQRVVEHVRLLARPSDQLEYEKNVPIANVPAELVSGFCDDLYSPKGLALSNAFTNDELKGLAHLYGLLVEAAKADVASVSELLKSPPWRAVIALAKELDDHYSRTA